MFQILWGDDEHTGADGAYVRVLRSRKWIYLAAAFTVLHSYHAVDFSALGQLLKGVLKIPAWMATLSLLSGLGYLLAQYSLLLVQFGSAYKSIISNRLPDNQEQQQAKLAIFNTKQNIAAILKRYSNPDEDVAALRAQMAGEETSLAYHEDRLARATKAEPTAQRLFRGPEYMVDWGRAILPLIVGGGAFLRLWITLPGY